MSVGDWMQQGYSGKQTVKILTVDPPNRHVEATLKDGGRIDIVVWTVSPVFRWPAVDEIWTVRQDSGYWVLDAVVESSPDQVLPIESLNPGDSRISTMVNIFSTSPILDPTNVKYWGAKGNGVMNDAPAINQAITYAATTGGGIVYIPPGNYKCNSTIVGKSNVTIQGAGENATHLIKNFNGDFITFNGSAPGVHCRFAGLRDVGIEGNDKTGRALNHVYADQICHMNVNVTSNIGPAIDMTEMWDSRFFNVVAGDCGSSTEPTFWIRSGQAPSGFGSTTDNSNIVRFYGCQAESYHQNAFRIEPGPSGSDPNKVFIMGETKIESFKLHGAAIWVAGPVTGLFISDFTIHMGDFDGVGGFNTPQPAIQIDQGANVVIERGLITNNNIATISEGARVWAGAMFQMKSVLGLYSTAPTAASAPHISLTNGGPYYVDGSNTCSSNATPIVRAGGVVNIAPLTYP